MLERLGQHWIELTLVALVVYLLVVNAQGVAQIVRVSTAGYTDAVRALQGR